jgi:hypothetical protein
MIFGSNVQKVYLGSQEISKILFNNSDVFSPPSPFNQILNSKFDADNQYPIADGSKFFNGNYFLTNYIHNSPLLYEYDSNILYSYHTFANRTFHEINSPYSILLLGHELQPRLLKMFGVGSRFGVPNAFYDVNGNVLRTITNTTGFTPADGNSWVKYGVEQKISIPSWATKARYGVSYLVKSSDVFRENNFAGLKLNFQKEGYRSYFNVHFLTSNLQEGVYGTNVISLISLYNTNSYTNFDADQGSNAMCQWAGPLTSRVKIKTASHTEVVPDGLDKFITITNTVDIPTFSTAGAEPDFIDGFSDTVSLEMFFAEWLPYLNDDDVVSGAIYFYEPFLYFE